VALAGPRLMDTTWALAVACDRCYGSLPSLHVSMRMCLCCLCDPWRWLMKSSTLTIVVSVGLYIQDPMIFALVLVIPPMAVRA
jgi:hypothetical protein